MGSSVTTTKLIPANSSTEEHLASQIPGDLNDVEDNGQLPPLIQREAFTTDDHEEIGAGLSKTLPEFHDFPL